MSGLLLVGVVAGILASILRKNQAIRELILGAQAAKDKAVSQGVPKAAVNLALQEQQSSTTEKIVQYAKADLKLKGVIQ